MSIQKAKEKGRKRDRDGDDEERPGPSQGRRQSSQRASLGIHCDREELQQLKNKVKKYNEEASKRESESNVTLSRVETESMLGQVVRHILFHNHHSPGIPVSRDDLNKLLASENENHKHKKHLLNKVLPEAQKRVLSIFGIEMKEVERSTNKEIAAAATTGKKFYVLSNALPTSLREQAVLRFAPSFSVPTRALTLVILAVIHLSGGKIEEPALIEWLSQLGVSMSGRANEQANAEDFIVGSDDDCHPVLGRVRQEVLSLEKTRWIVKLKEGEGGHFYRWGEVAREQVSEEEFKSVIECEFKDQGGQGGVGRGR